MTAAALLDPVTGSWGALSSTSDHQFCPFAQAVQACAFSPAHASPQSHWWPQEGLFYDTGPEPFCGNTSVTVYKPSAALTDSYLMSLTQVFTGSSGFQPDILKACLRADLSRLSAGRPVTFSNSLKCSDGWSWGLLPAAGDWKQAHLGDIIQLRAGARCLPCPGRRLSTPARPPCALSPAREQCCRWYPALSSSQEASIACIETQMCSYEKLWLWCGHSPLQD